MAQSDNNNGINLLLEYLENLMFLNIFKCFKLAIGPNKMLLSFFCILLLALVGVSLDSFTGTVHTGKYNIKDGLAYNSTTSINELDAYLIQEELLKELINQDSSKTTQGVYLTMWDFTTKNFNEAIVSILSLDMRGLFRCGVNEIRAFNWALKYHFLYSLVYLSIAYCILAYFGGAITRAAALEFSLGEKPGPAELMRYCRKHLKSYLFAPIAPLAVVFCLGCLIVALGLIANLPWAGEIILGLSIIIALILGLFIAIVLIGAFGGVSLMLPAISYEGTSGYDALGRAYCYTYSRPWKLLYYSVISIFYGSICYMFVRFIAFLLLKMTHTFLKFGMFAESARTQGVSKLEAIWREPEFFNLLGRHTNINYYLTESLSSGLVHLAILLILGVVAAFVVSYYFCANTVIYALMRKEIDKNQMTEIYTELQNLKDDWKDVESTDGDSYDSTDSIAIESDDTQNIG